MDWAFPEKMARHGTGRPTVPTLERGGAGLIVYPDNLIYRGFFPVPGEDQSSNTYFLKFAAGSGSNLPFRTGYMRFMADLFKILPLCSWLDLHLISDRGARLSVVTAVIAARLFGVAVCLQDNRFRSEGTRKLSNLIYPLCRRLVLGDVSAVSGGIDYGSNLVFRNELMDLAPYRKYAKERAIPRVIVYGDLEEPKTVSLVRRTHELVRQKYPRTEFIMASFISSVENSNHSGTADHFLQFAAIENDESLNKLFEKADSVMLLTPGGLNRSFRRRARAAGYPLIINGFENVGNDSEAIIVTRDSYSGLAEAVIRLVDNDQYYRSFAVQ